MSPVLIHIYGRVQTDYSITGEYKPSEITGVSAITGQHLLYFTSIDKHNELKTIRQKTTIVLHYIHYRTHLFNIERQAWWLCGSSVRLGYTGLHVRNPV